MSHLVLVQEAGPIFNKNPDGGAFIISSSVAVGETLSALGSDLTLLRAYHKGVAAWVTLSPKLPGST